MSLNIHHVENMSEIKVIHFNDSYIVLYNFLY
jgi:hypothetical protein